MTVRCDAVRCGAARRGAVHYVRARRAWTAVRIGSVGRDWCYMRHANTDLCGASWSSCAARIWHEAWWRRGTRTPRLASSHPPLISSLRFPSGPYPWRSDALDAARDRHRPITARTKLPISLCACMISPTLAKSCLFFSLTQRLLPYSTPLPLATLPLLFHSPAHTRTLPPQSFFLRVPAVAATVSDHHHHHRTALSSQRNERPLPTRRRSTPRPHHL